LAAGRAFWFWASVAVASLVLASSAFTLAYANERDDNLSSELRDDLASELGPAVGVSVDDRASWPWVVAGVALVAAATGAGFLAARSGRRIESDIANPS
jgi:amino acid transporter